MANPQEATQDIGPDPDLSIARLAAIGQTPPAPLPPEHPMIAFARNLLNPANYAQEPFDSGTYTPPMPSPTQPQIPAGFNPYAAPAQPAPTGVLGGINDFLKQSIAPVQGAVEGNIADLRSFTGLGPQSHYFGSPQALQDATGLFNYTKAGSGGLADVHVPGAAVDLARGLPEAAPKFARDEAGMARIDFGLNGPESAAGVEGGLANRIGGKSQGVGPGEDLFAQQVKALKAGGATDAEIADFTKTMAPPPEAPKARTIQTAEGQAVDPGLLTRSLQTAAGQEGVPLSQHPDFAAYGKGGPKVGSKGAVGGDIGTATRAVMAGDPKAMSILGPDLTQQLIQNKIAQIVRETGAPEDVIRRGLSVMGPGAKTALATSEQVATVGRNAQKVSEALGAPLLADEMANLRNKGYVSGPLSDAEKARAAETGVTPPESAPLEPQAPAPASGGVPPPKGPTITTPSGDATLGPLPKGPSPVTAQSIGLEALRIVTDIPRSLMVIGHLPALRQALPLISDAVARGNPGEVPLAFARSFQSVIGNDLTNAAMTQSFRDAIEGAGLKVGRDGVQITDPLGPVGAREEFGLHSVLAKVPGIKNVQRAMPTMLNSLRTGAAVDLANMVKTAGGDVTKESARIGHMVNIASGRGDIPGMLDTPVGREVLSGVFFGPRLMTSSWQMAADTIKSLGRAAGMDSLGAVNAPLKALNPLDIAQIRTAAAYVATGVGIMKLANTFGLNIGTDPTKTDFGRITLPDGKRLDLWGPFNENARLIAREIDFIQGALQKKPGYGATTGAERLLDFFRSKLNAGAPTAAGDLFYGETAGGQSLQEAYGNPDLTKNPLVPLPFNVREAINAFGPGGTGGALGAGEVAATALGGTVIDTPPRITYDGVGKPDTDPQFNQDPVLQESVRFTKEDPTRSKVLGPPNTTLGSGKNAFKLDAVSAPAYIAAVGAERIKEVGALIYSPEYQNATTAQQEKLYDAAVTKADNTADRQFLAHGVIDSTDPAVIQQEAVVGFHAQGGSAKNEAYWIALLDRAGKLTPAVSQAIDNSNVTSPGKKAAITVDEYLKAAPLVHEYLAHVPYGTDAHPIGAATDWTTVAQAHVSANTRKDELLRQGVSPLIADATAKRETLASLSLVQRNIYLNGTQLQNPARILLARKNPTLSKFLGPNPSFTNESDDQYQNFPFGSP